jgi:hypothetical protein
MDSAGSMYDPSAGAPWGDAMSDTIYRCEFRLGLLRTLSVKSFDGIAAFKDGFWVDVNFIYTKGSNAMYWIPPSAIIYIVKEAHP